MQVRGLGLRAASLPHKVSCICTALSFECDGAARLDTFLKSGVSGTFDLGAEYGVGDVAHADFWSHSSKDVQPSRVEPDDGDIHGEFAEDSFEDRSFLFQNMLSIAALLHILDNVAKDLHNSLTDFDKCMTYTLAICSLLCNEGARQAFLHRVVRGGGFDHHVGLFESTFPLHSEHRWLSLINTMSWLLPLKDVLIEVWSPRLFGTYESKEGAVKVDLITTAITSKWFWVFVDHVSNIVFRVGGDGFMGRRLPVSRQAHACARQNKCQCASTAFC